MMMMMVLLLSSYHRKDRKDKERLAALKANDYEGYLRMLEGEYQGSTQATDVKDICFSLGSDVCVIVCMCMYVYVMLFINRHKE